MYVINRLPILRKWKIVFLLICLLHTYPFDFGLNYTFLRFALPIAFLVLGCQTIEALGIELPDSPVSSSPFPL